MFVLPLWIMESNTTHYKNGDGSGVFIILQIIPVLLTSTGSAFEEGIEGIEKVA